MAGFIRYAVIASGSTYTMPQNGYVIIGANGATVTVSIDLDNTETPNYYDITETVDNAKAKAIPFKLPQGAVLKFTGSAVKLIAYD